MTRSPRFPFREKYRIKPGMTILRREKLNLTESNPWRDDLPTTQRKSQPILFFFIPLSKRASVAVTSPIADQNLRCPCIDFQWIERALLASDLWLMVIRSFPLVY